MRSHVIAVVLGAILAEPSAAQLTQRVDVGFDGRQARFGADVPSFPSCPILSGDGRFVVFMSYSPNLVRQDTNGQWDLFLRDRRKGINERIDVRTGGAETGGSGLSYGAAVTPDGRFVVFDTTASDLVPGDTNQLADVFVRDRLAGTTERVSVGMGGAESNGPSDRPCISDDGRYVSFESAATNLVPGDSNGMLDAFVYDRLTGATELVSVAMNGSPGGGSSHFAVISGDGRCVAFVSDASDLVTGDTNGSQDIFVRDLQSRRTERVSVSSSAAQADGNSSQPAISADGRFVAFASSAENLVAGDSNQKGDVFVRDRVAGTTERVSLASDGSESDRDSDSPAISGDGRFVAFNTAASLVHGDSGYYDVYVRDRRNGITERVSQRSDGSPAHGNSMLPSISRDGLSVAFASDAVDLVDGDTNGYADVYVHASAATNATLLCVPAVDGVRGCPCSNAPSGAGRGCENSSGTGGASLRASGIAYLTTDTLTFRAQGEVDGAASFLVQGSAPFVQGAIYGQGIRCVAGAMKRLYTKRAANGDTVVPDPESGDLPISARSAAMGDIIQPGESRWYLVQYRDPVVLGGCAASSTFNSTPTVMIDWWF